MIRNELQRGLERKLDSKTIHLKLQMRICHLEEKELVLKSIGEPTDDIRDEIRFLNVVLGNE